jgi:Mg/Co/Ni transporter MgtE
MKKEQIYPRKWNHDFIQLPVVQKDKQRRPAVTAHDVMDVLSKNQEADIFAVVRFVSRDWHPNRRSARVEKPQISDLIVGCFRSAEAFGAARSRNQKLRTQSA